MIGDDTVPDRSRWIPWAFVGFFAVVVAANGTLLYFALDSWTGLATTDAYQKGLAYNDELADRRRQAALGWQVDFTATPDRPGHLLFELSVGDARGVPVSSARVTVRLTRPTHDGHDFETTLAHRGGGRYAGATEVPLAGQWALELLIDGPRGPYRQAERVLVP